MSKLLIFGLFINGLVVVVSSKQTKATKSVLLSVITNQHGGQSDKTTSTHLHNTGEGATVHEHGNTKAGSAKGQAKSSTGDQTTVKITSAASLVITSEAVKSTTVKYAAKTTSGSAHLHSPQPGLDMHKSSTSATTQTTQAGTITTTTIGPVQYTSVFNDTTENERTCKQLDSGIKSIIDATNLANQSKLCTGSVIRGTILQTHGYIDQLTNEWASYCDSYEEERLNSMLYTANEMQDRIVTVVDENPTGCFQGIIEKINDLIVNVLVPALQKDIIEERALP